MQRQSVRRHSRLPAAEPWPNSFKLFLASGAYAILCIPGILVAEHLQWSQWFFHASQLAALLLCFAGAVIFLFRPRRAPAGWKQMLAFLVVVLAGLFLAMFVWIITTLNFGLPD
jgi:hypothetical protein